MGDAGGVDLPTLSRDGKRGSRRAAQVTVDEGILELSKQCPGQACILGCRWYA